MARPSPAAAIYQRHQPERTVLYRTIATHLPTFFARPAGEDGTGGWPAFVRREFEAYLKCGRLELTPPYTIRGGVVQQVGRRRSQRKHYE